MENCCRTEENISAMVSSVTVDNLVMPFNSNNEPVDNAAFSNCSITDTVTFPLN